MDSIEVWLHWTTNGNGLIVQFNDIMILIDLFLLTDLCEREWKQRSMLYFLMRFKILYELLNEWMNGKKIDDLNSILDCMAHIATTHD